MSVHDILSFCDYDSSIPHASFFRSRYVFVLLPQLVVSLLPVHCVALSTFGKHENFIVVNARSVALSWKTELSHASVSYNYKKQLKIPNGMVRGARFFFFILYYIQMATMLCFVSFIRSLVGPSVFTFHTVFVIVSLCDN